MKKKKLQSDKNPQRKKEGTEAVPFSLDHEQTPHPLEKKDDTPEAPQRRILFNSHGCLLFEDGTEITSPSEIVNNTPPGDIRDAMLKQLAIHRPPWIDNLAQRQPQEEKIKIKKTKKGLIVDAVLLLREAYDYEDSILSVFPKNLSLKIIAQPEDWRMLYVLSSVDEPEYLGSLIWKMAREVYEKEIKKIDYPTGRGPHAAVVILDGRKWTEEEYMWYTKAYGAAAYYVVSHHLKKDRAEWPPFFKELMNSIEESLDSNMRRRFKKTSGRWRPVPVVAHLVERRFGMIRQKFGKKPFREIIPKEEQLRGMNFKEEYLKGKNNKLFLPMAKRTFEIEKYQLTIEELFGRIT